MAKTPLNLMYIPVSAHSPGVFIWVYSLVLQNYTPLRPVHPC